ncbi:VTC domain-containing protein [Lachnospiraceae bacterium]|nr:VTC domain-containing protein [Lachnospiraceae bacterium]
MFFNIKNKSEDLGWRHELKYLGTDASMRILQARFGGILRGDSHTRPDGTYLIRSIYFDDADDHYFYSNEAGVDPRQKYRIRAYNCDTSFISLECKMKESGMTKKLSERITMDDYRMLMTGEGAAKKVSNPETPPLLRKVLLLRLTDGLKPRIIVQYERVPYIYPLGNVRITFDRKISSSEKLDDFFSENLAVRPVLPLGQSLLEVKYDGYLPDGIADTLHNDTLRYTSFSKYYFCRKFAGV